MKHITRIFLSLILVISQSFAVTLQEKYDWFFTMTPKKYHEELSDTITDLENLKDKYYGKNFSAYVKNVSQEDRFSLRMLDEYLEAKKSDPTIMQDDHNRLRNRMGKFLMYTIIPEQEDVLTALVGTDSYPAVAFGTKYTGKGERKKRYEVCPDTKNPHCHQSVYQYDSGFFLQNDDRSKLSALYKIHLMTEANDTLLALQYLLEGMQHNEILNSLIEQIKVYTALKEQKDLLGGLFGMIVIYPVSGQKNVQLLMDELVKIFKNFKGTGHAPRYNIKLNDLIWYAQSGGDDKMWLERNKRDLATIFDKSTKYALYRPDFEKIKDPKEFEKFYVPSKNWKPEDNPYALVIK